jgi:hypothetical protein
VYDQYAVLVLKLLSVIGRTLPLPHLTGS